MLTAGSVLPPDVQRTAAGTATARMMHWCCALVGVGLGVTWCVCMYFLCRSGKVVGSLAGLVTTAACTVGWMAGPGAVYSERILLGSVWLGAACQLPHHMVGCCCCIGSGCCLHTTTGAVLPACCRRVASMLCPHHSIVTSVSVWGHAAAAEAGALHPASARGGPELVLVTCKLWVPAAAYAAAGDYVWQV